MSGGIGSAAFQPIVDVQVASGALDLGRVSLPGQYKATDRMVIDIRANVPHMGVIAELSPLVCENRRSRWGRGKWGRGKIVIPPKNVQVRTAQLGRYVSMNRPVNLTGPMKPGVSEVTATFQVMVDSLMPPGEYSGVLTLTCAPPP